MAPQVRPFPANLLKFNAYIKVTDSIESAIDIIRKKRLAYGEPCVVTYKVEDKKVPSGYSLRVLFGIGTMNPDDPYFFGLYNSGSGIVSIDQVMPELQEIIDEFYGKELTYIRYSVGETPTLTTEFKGGNITLGEAAIKHVIDSVDISSDCLVTSKAIYDFIMTLLHSLEEEINSERQDIDNKINDLNTAVSENTMKITHLIDTVDTVSKDVSTLKVRVGKLENDTSSYITGLVSDSSSIYIRVDSHTAHIRFDLENEFAENIHRNDDGKISLFWNSYEQ